MQKKDFNADKNAPRNARFRNQVTDIETNMKIPLSKEYIRDLPSQAQGQRAVTAEAGDIKFN